jgi:acyl-coenzyme A synthetase/AMP-(fatty) acid ligase
MAPKAGGTPPGGKHEYAVPFAHVGDLFAKYKERDAEKVALVDVTQDTSITFGQLHDWSNKIANWLVGKGIKKGDRVALLTEERLEKLILWMGIWRAGAVCCPTNVEMNIAYVAEILGNLECKIALYDADLDINQMTDGVDIESIKFAGWANNLPGDAESDEAFTQIAAVPPSPELGRHYVETDDATIFCTSGTTDKPKNFLIDHLAHWSFGMSTIDQIGLTDQDKTLEFRSFGWNSPQGLSLMPWLATGCTLHIARRFSHSNFFEWIKNHEITFSAGIPTVINMLLDRPTGVTSKDVPSLRLMSSSTAPLNPDRWKQFEETYGINLLQFFGCSEGGWVCGNRHYAKKYGTVGPPAKHQEFLLVDEDGNAVNQGEEGEVTLGGPQCAKASMTAEGFWEELDGRRVRLGDLAVMDSDGFITVTGRLKDLIIRGGVNISPVEVDNVMMQHPKVYEAAAVGVPDAIYGEEIVAYVVVREGQTLTEEEINTHCAETLADYRLPKQFHFIEALPKNDRGKVRRPDLQEMWNQEQA